VLLHLPYMVYPFLDNLVVLAVSNAFLPSSLDRFAASLRYRFLHALLIIFSWPVVYPRDRTEKIALTSPTGKECYNYCFLTYSKDSYIPTNHVARRKGTWLQTSSVLGRSDQGLSSISIYFHVTKQKKTFIPTLADSNITVGSVMKAVQTNLTWY